MTKIREKQEGDISRPPVLSLDPTVFLGKEVNDEKVMIKKIMKYETLIVMKAHQQELGNFN